MRTSTLRRWCLGLATVTLITTVSAGTASADTGGTVTGHFRTADGSPIATAVVQVYSAANFSFLGFAITDDTGAYAVTGLPAGGVKVAFQRGGLSQYARGRTNLGDADVIDVADGGTTVLDETALPTGTIVGTFLDSAGQPLGGVSVVASGFGDTAGTGSTSTGSDGHFRVEVFPGTYTVGFTVQSGGQTQYWHGRISQDRADTVTVAAGRQVVADDQALPTGSMSGRYTTADGQPVKGAFVGAELSFGGFSGFAKTDDNGNWRLPRLFAGTYRVSFFRSDFTHQQYAFGKLGRDRADLIPVTAGQEATVNDSELPVGTIVLTATDTRTGQALADFCASTDGAFACSNGTGTVTLDDLAQGPHDITVFTDNSRYFDARLTVDVVGNASTRVAARLRPAAVIETTIVDSVTGQPVPNACVAPLKPPFGHVPEGFGACADEHGAVRVGPLEADTYTLYAAPFDDTVHGAQWVGPSGGTGTQLLARRIKPAVGVVTRVPPIRLDHAGTVTGTVTDAATGRPVANADVTISANHPGVGATGPDAVTDADGHYTLTGLGPYRWPLISGANGYAPQWTGGIASRLLSPGVQVVADGSTTANVALTKGTRVTVRTSGSPSPLDGWAVAVDNLTEDVMGACFLFASDASCTLNALPNQVVRIGFIGDDATFKEYVGTTGPVAIRSADLAVTVPVSPQ
jgi:hypothetical protein